jgi:hypothetical protein
MTISYAFDAVQRPTSARMGPGTTAGDYVYPPMEELAAGVLPSIVPSLPALLAGAEAIIGGEHLRCAHVSGQENDDFAIGETVNDFLIGCACRHPLVGHEVASVFARADDVIAPELFAGSDFDGAGPREIIGCPGMIAGENDYSAELRITPQISARVTYQIDGDTLKGVATFEVGGLMHSATFAVDLRPIMRMLLDIHFRAHGGKQLDKAMGPKIGFWGALKKAFNKITSPVRKIVEKAKKVVHSAVKKAAQVAKATGRAVGSAVKSAYNSADKLVQKYARPYILAKRAAEKIAKSKIVKAIGNGMKAVLRSPITAAAVGALAIAFPPVGGPVAAGYAVANKALAAVEAAQFASKAISNAVQGKLNLGNMLKDAAGQALQTGASLAAGNLAAKLGPQAVALTKTIDGLRKQAGPILEQGKQALAQIKSLSDKAKAGDKDAQKSLQILRTVRTAQKEIRRNAVATALRTHTPTTPIGKVATVYNAVRDYYPLANTPFANYHPTIAKMRAQLAAAAKQGPPISTQAARAGAKASAAAYAAAKRKKNAQLLAAARKRVAELERMSGIFPAGTAAPLVAQRLRAA